MCNCTSEIWSCGLSRNDGGESWLHPPPESCTLPPMEWTDEGIVLGVRRHGESSAIVELLTRGHGRHLGLVRGGAGSRMRPLLQPGNGVRAVWRARLDEHLGYYVIEGTRLRAATVLSSSHAVYGVTHLASLARLLPERDPHEDIYEMLDRTLDDFDDIGEAAAHLIRFELAMLAELGFGLDLENCAATGATTDLIYVSPKSGSAVSRAAGDAWRDRLLRLPAFLREGEGGANSWSDQDLQDGFRLTGMFLLRHVLEPRGQGHSDAREGFINAVAKYRARVAQV
jgi:DNA repair protein RecO (recombination protein O)